MERKYSLSEILPEINIPPKTLPTSDELDALILKQYAELKELYSNEYEYKSYLSMELAKMINMQKMTLYCKQVEQKFFKNNNTNNSNLY